MSTAPSIDPVMPVADRWFVTTQVGDRLNVIVEPYVHFFDACAFSGWRSAEGVR